MSPTTMPTCQPSRAAAALLAEDRGSPDPTDVERMSGQCRMALCGTSPQSARNYGADQEDSAMDAGTEGELLISINLLMSFC